MCPSKECCCYRVCKTVVPCEVKTITTTKTCVVDPCCSVNEQYLNRLKKSNDELKGLIKKLDNLSESMSVEEECKCCSSSKRRNSREIVITEHHYNCCSPLPTPMPKLPPPPPVIKPSCCGLCRDNSKNVHTIKCDYIICEKCEKVSFFLYS